MITRRALFRGLSLAALAVASADLMAGCGNGTVDRPVAAGRLELVSADVRRGAGDPAAVPAVVAATHALGAGLYGSLAGDHSDNMDNLAISPYSAELALGLTVNGAVGRTRTEMLHVLGVPDLDRLDAGLNVLSADLEALAGPVTYPQGAVIALDSANALFGQAGEHWQAAFLDALARDFGAGMHTVDWKGATEAARTAVNGWTSTHTHGRIPTILPAGSVDPTTRLVLVNALYFKAPWAAAFDKDSTTPAAFTLDDGTEVQVPMMSGATEPAAYASGRGWQAARLEYAGGTLAMTVVLPDAGGLADLEKQVADGVLPRILAAFDDQGNGPSRGASVTMPRFTFSSAQDLTKPLGHLGMPTAFTPAADFSGMTQDDSLQISAVLQQVFVAVDEGGTEAAAATAVIAFASGAVFRPRELVLDRPFLFCIHDVQHGTPLFVGRLADPRI